MLHRRHPSPPALLLHLLLVLGFAFVTFTPGNTAAASSASIHDPTVAGNVLYLAPTEFHAALQPLLAHRARQGIRARLIDTQSIYDAWSDGRPSTMAIRAYLRHARDTWPERPHTVVFVGVVDVIPTFFDKVDPYNATTACDWCLVQLDGAHPTDDDSADLRFRLALGRSRRRFAGLVAAQSGVLRSVWRRLSAGGRMAYPEQCAGAHAHAHCVRGWLRVDHVFRPRHAGSLGQHRAGWRRRLVAAEPRRGRAIAQQHAAAGRP
jgi:hypothetical protein